MSSILLVGTSNAPKLEPAPSHISILVVPQKMNHISGDPKQTNGVIPVPRVGAICQVGKNVPFDPLPPLPRLDTMDCSPSKARRVRTFCRACRRLVSGHPHGFGVFFSVVFVGKATKSGGPSNKRHTQNGVLDSWPSWKEELDQSRHHLEGGTG